MELNNSNSNQNTNNKPQEIKINNQYSFKSNDRLGSGSFGQIFKGMNIKTREEVAIKIESTNIETPQLLHEYKILKNFQNIKESDFVTKMKQTLPKKQKKLDENLLNNLLSDEDEEISFSNINKKENKKGWDEDEE